MRVHAYVVQTSVAVSVCTLRVLRQSDIPMMSRSRTSITEDCSLLSGIPALRSVFSTMSFLVAKSHAWLRAGGCCRSWHLRQLSFDSVSKQYEANLPRPESGPGGCMVRWGCAMSLTCLGLSTGYCKGHNNAAVDAMQVGAFRNRSLRAQVQ